jgi:hypothetical protein
MATISLLYCSTCHTLSPSHDQPEKVASLLAPNYKANEVFSLCLLSELAASEAGVQPIYTVLACLPSMHEPQGLISSTSSLLLPSDQDVEFSALSPAPRLSACPHASLCDNNE